jgi:Alginate export
LRIDPQSEINTSKRGRDKRGMRDKIRVLALLGVVSAIPVFAGSGDAGTSGDPGTVLIDSSPFQKLPSWIDFGGQIRGRFEGPSGMSMINNTQENYYASRIRIHLGIMPTPWLRFFAEAQDARTGGYSVSPAPNTLYNPLDFRQGYAELNFEGSTSTRFRAGRQELAFGGERLIGPGDWGMSRTFDALDLTLSRGPAQMDLFAANPVAIDPTRIDRDKPGVHLYGAYGSIKHVIPRMNIEPYLLYDRIENVKSTTSVKGDALVISPGARVFGTTPGRFDYTAEMVVQRGSYSTDSVRALGESYVAGWTIVDSKWKPRVSVEYNYASGDPHQVGLHETFDQFYPSNHGYYGMIDQFGWRNLKNARAGFDFLATKKLKIRTDFNEFYLATVEDGLYNSSGTAIVMNRTATSSHIGSETNTVALYTLSKVWKFGAGYGRLFAGEYLKQSKLGYGYTYPYVMMVGSF